MLIGVELVLEFEDLVFVFHFNFLDVVGFQSRFVVLFPDDDFGVLFLEFLVEGDDVGLHFGDERVFDTEGELHHLVLFI